MWWKIKGFDFIDAVHWFFAERSISSLAWGITSYLGWRTTSLMVWSSRWSTSIIKSRSRWRLHQKITFLLLIILMLLFVRINHLKKARNWEITASHIIWSLCSQMCNFHRNSRSVDIKILFYARSLDRHTSLVGYLQGTIIN